MFILLSALLMIVAVSSQWQIQRDLKSKDEAFSTRTGSIDFFTTILRAHKKLFPESQKRRFFVLAIGLFAVIFVYDLIHYHY